MNKSRLHQILPINKTLYLSALALLMVSFLGSCVSYNDLVSFTAPPGMPDQAQQIDNFEAVRVQPNDILRIRISGADPLSMQPFLHGATGEEQSVGTSDFLVNSRGEINFPTLGKIQVRNMETEVIGDTILARMAPYFAKLPIVDVALTNFKVNVNGEVGNPGIFAVQNERVTILDALTLAGDFTSYSRRDSILIIRERDGLRTFGYIDLNSAEAFRSPYFYLKQNDVVYVRPQKTKTNSVRDPSSRFLPWVSVIASLTVVVVSIARLR